ncbi:hypothetical protein V8F33_002675 [Rhypophila sp. PSN 637]
MPAFLTVNNHVSLLSITIAPSAWVAFLVLALVFLFLYLPPISSLIPGRFFLRRIFSRRRHRKEAPQLRGGRSSSPIYEEDEEDDDDEFYHQRRRHLQNRNRLLLTATGGGNSYQNKPLPPLIAYPWGDEDRPRGGRNESPEELDYYDEQRRTSTALVTTTTTSAESSRKRDKEKKRSSTSSSRRSFFLLATMRPYGPLDPLEHLDAHPQHEEFDPKTVLLRPKLVDKSSSRTVIQHPHHHHSRNNSSSSTCAEDLTVTEVMEDLTSDNESLLSEEQSAGGYSPPAWRRLGNGDRNNGFWRNHHPLSQQDDPYDDDFLDNDGLYMSENEDCKEERKDEEDEEILRRAIQTRLPRGSMSPDKERSPEPDYFSAGAAAAGRTLGGIEEVIERDGRTVKSSVLVKREAEEEREKRLAAVAERQGAGMDRRSLWSEDAKEEPSDNYFRFAVRAEVQHRTEPIESAIVFLRTKLGFMFRSRSNFVLSTLVAILSYAALKSLFLEPAAMRPSPDLVKVAGVARAFEPLIYYSESGIQQVGDLQATGVAVWDLGETVRNSNMTSAPIIVKELDDLSDSLKTLAIELTKFFANVDGDIDGILIVMDWARRELSQLPSSSPSTISSSPSSVLTSPLSNLYDNMHNLLSTAGILENPQTGTPTQLGLVLQTIFGQSTPQRTRQTLQRTFNEFLSVLEEAIESELTHSLSLFGLFEAIDNQFQNLARTVVRESNRQEELHTEHLLSSLWTRILGPKASEVAKFERNRLLLQDVKTKTVRNKGILIEHNRKLLGLKASLESLRRKLVSPLVRSVNSSTLSIEEQIRGLEDVGGFLEGVRARQKSKLMDMLYGGGGSGSMKGVEGAQEVREGRVLD